MSRPWSRFGVRASAVVLLLVSIAGGYYLSEDRRIQERDNEARQAARVNRAEWKYLKQRHAAYTVVAASKRAAEYEASRKAAAEAKLAAERARLAEEAVSRKNRLYAGPIPESCEEYEGNRKIGCAVLLDSGFDLSEMPCLDKLWSKESGWNEKAHNSNGAYGIPQALPGSKMASVGDDWRDNPATQIKWGLGYVERKYGTPCKAWEHWVDTGWY